MGPHSWLRGDNSGVAVAVFLLPPLPSASLHPLFPVTGASTEGEAWEGEADVLAATRQGKRRAGLCQGVCLHCDAGHFFQHLLFCILLA